MVYGNLGKLKCTLTGGDYEEKNGDYWLKVYQVKMKTYKRVPIPEALYKLVQVYKKKYKIVGIIRLKAKKVEHSSMLHYGIKC